MMLPSPILTIIVPSYKTRPYLEYTLPRYAQLFNCGLICVVFIDDGSPDDTSQYIQTFVKKFPRLFSLYTKKNGGHGSVINFAVHSIVNTKYFRIVDGDDYVDPEEIIQFAKELQHINADIVIDNPTIRRGSLVFKMPLRQAEPGYINVNDADPTLAGTTYKTELWTNKFIYVLERVYYEDLEYNLFPLAYASSVYYSVHYTVVVMAGNPRQSTAPRSMTAHLNDIIKLINHVKKFESEHPALPPIYKIRSEEVQLNYFSAYIEFSWAYSVTAKEAAKKISVLRKQPWYGEYISKIGNRYKLICRYGYVYILLLRIGRRAKHVFCHKKDVQAH